MKLIRPPESANVTSAVEAIPTLRSAEYDFRLYVTGSAPRSLRAAQNLREVCEAHLQGRYQLEIIDICQQPEEARSNGIVVTPTLIKSRPSPSRRFHGDLSNADRVLVWLGIAAGAETVAGHASTGSAREAAEDPKATIQELTQRLAEAEDTLRALRSGEVDAVVGAEAGGGLVYTLAEGARVTDLTDENRNEELAVSEKLSRAILEDAAEAILVVDPEGRIVRASRAADRLAGTGVVLKKFGDVFEVRSPGGLSLSWESMSAMARHEGGTAPLEMSVAIPSGERCDVLFSVARLGLTDGGRAWCIVHLTDITHRKRIEKGLRASEEMHRWLADAMPQIVYVNQPDGRCEFVNRKWVEFTGESSTPESLDFARNARFHPDDREIALQRWERAVATGQPFEAERRLLRHDGQYRWHLSRAVPIRDDDGSIIKWVGTSTDIHEFKRNETLLRESEARLGALAETVPEILFTAEPDGQSDYSSPRAYQFTGMTSGTMDGAGWLDSLHPEDTEAVRQAWTASICSRERFSAEFRMRQADGTYRWMRSHAVPMLGPKNEVLKWFGTCTDIDDHKRLEASLRRRSEELARSNEELQRFAHIVSHDLQEPLRTVNAMSQLLCRQCAGKIDQEGENLLGYIQDGVKRMSDLIRDLLDYSRVSSEPDAELKPVDCESLLSFALMNVQAQIAETGATVTRDPMPVVAGDEQLLRVFQNLIGNALKYRGESAPEIHVSAAKQGDDWIISVRDNGIGIEMQYAERIFGIFQRLHSREAYEGTGIGLAICRKIAERCGGRIWVESEPGQGATFRLLLHAAKGFAPAGEGIAATDAMGISL